MLATLSLLAALLLGAPAVQGEAGTAPQDAAEAFPGRVTLQDLSIEQRQRVHRLWTQVICNCPRENWSRTLANCPDGCAEGQKNQIKAQVLAGRSDEEILAIQKEENGPRVLSSPGLEGSGKWAYILPFAGLAAGAIFVTWVLRRWQRAAHVSLEERQSVPEDRIEEEELLAVERELEEID